MADPLGIFEMLTFTTDETEALVRALSAGQRTFTTKDALALMEWAQETRLRHSILTMALQGTIGLSMHKGEVQACPLDSGHAATMRRIPDGS